MVYWQIVVLKFISVIFISSDKYNQLDIKLYSAFKNLFYNTNCDNVFNCDF